MKDLDHEKYRFGMAHKMDEVLEALKLVHQVYNQEGYTNEEQKELGYRILQHHLTGESTVFFGKKGPDVIFSVSLFSDSAFGLPMDDIFKDELDRLREKNLRLGEVGCLATHPSVRNNSQLIPMHGNKILFYHAYKNLKLDELVITVHPKHQPIYEDLLLFRQIGSLKHYGAVNGNPAVALHLNINEAKERFRKMYCGKPLSQDLHDFMFERRSRCLKLINQDVHHSGPSLNYSPIPDINSLTPGINGSSGSWLLKN